MEKLKIFVDLLKFKVTIFSTIVGGVIYLVLNKAKIVAMISQWVYLFMVVLLIVYGVIGFMYNFSLLTKYMKMLQKGVDNEL